MGDFFRCAGQLRGSWRASAGLWSSRSRFSSARARSIFTRFWRSFSGRGQRCDRGPLPPDAGAGLQSKRRGGGAGADGRKRHPRSRAGGKRRADCPRVSVAPVPDRNRYADYPAAGAAGVDGTRRGAVSDRGRLRLGISLLGLPIPTLQSLDTRGRVIYLNTFSKTIAPALRISYMILPQALLARWRSTMGFYSCAVPSFEQLTLTRFFGRRLL